MPLSEQEQRLLDEMERNLLHNDADVVSAAASGRAFSYRNLVYGALLIVAGLGTLIAGVALFRELASTQYVGIAVGVLGFLLMFGGAMLAIRRTDVPDFEEQEPREDRRGAYQGRDQSFMDRLNDRWDRRQDPEH